MYYIIQDDNYYTCENERTLRFLYPDNTVYVLPDDYEPKKYIVKNNELVLNPNFISEALKDAKENKISYNDMIRDEALLGGVLYKGVLFDSDVDQKVNLLATIGMMGNKDTITWFGMDNQGLECNKEDLTNIGQLIIKLHSYCWNLNAYIKEQIERATTLEELSVIEINYSLPIEETEEEIEIDE